MKKRLRHNPQRGPPTRGSAGKYSLMKKRLRPWDSGTYGLFCFGRKVFADEEAIETMPASHSASVMFRRKVFADEEAIETRCRSLPSPHATRPESIR